MDIFISPKRILTQFECGTKAGVFSLIAGTDVPHLLDEGEYAGLNEPVVFHRRGIIRWYPLNLPEAFTEAARLFLSDFHMPQDMSFDCYSFACLAAGLPLHPKEELLRYWNIQKVNPYCIFGPKIIFFADEKTAGFGHAALHIGRSYFLSVQGAGGSLSVSKLSDLRKQYRHRPDILVATPRKEALVQN